SSWQHWYWAKNGALGSELAAAYPDATKSNDELTFRLVRDAATLLEKGSAPFPIESVQGTFAHIAIGTNPEVNVINEYLDRYAKFDHFTNVAPKSLLSHESIVLSFHQDPKNPWRRYKLTSGEKALISGLKAAGKPLYVLHFANPYGLLTFPEIGENAKVLVMYENNAQAQKLAPQFLFGARSTKGKLPVELNGWGAQGSGQASQCIKRLGYGLPSEVGVNGDRLQKVDSIMDFAMSKEATPGGQILVARSGTVIYDKSFGYHSYSKKKAVDWMNLYDLASVTKITATLPGVMNWYEKQPLLLKSTVGQQLPELATSDKGTLVLEDVLAHQSGLPAWIPYYLRTIETDSAKAYWYVSPDIPGAIKVTNELYLRPEICDTMYAMLRQIGLKGNEYRYSDLGYYLFQRMLEKRNNESLDTWVNSTFYLPLGANRMTFKPLEKGFGLEEIVPTEEDGYWRNTIVHGSVHDMGAAMMGGVAGHAGLFSNSNSLAKMMQMYLWDGEYGGVKFLEKSTIDKFTACAFCEHNNRRGLGFDRPQLEEGSGPSCTCASSVSFGHTGFTGTMVWMDPEEELLYIFLSNRTYPDMENWKLNKHDIRTNIQSVLYESLN
ncbi:MAG TPA: beta-N-acetylglucosaminidase, partial [Cryomorphaceae bacterium]|nr:beta-N-acetylglucosaminidase [Cryomorphaceae bacterium]